MAAQAEQAYEENGAKPTSTWLGHQGQAQFDLRSRPIVVLNQANAGGYPSWLV